MAPPAVFMDRDGTICREAGYINDPSRLLLARDAGPTIRRINELGWRAIVVTNQAGVARGYFPFHLIEETHDKLRRLLDEHGARLDGIYCCVHHPDVGGPGFRADCECRKPKPGMLLAAAREHELELHRSFMIGDSFKDVGAGRAAGVQGAVLLRTGYGRGELIHQSHTADHWPDHVADDLSGAIRWIEEQTGSTHD